MTEEREAIVMAVLDGKLDVSHITMDELKEIQQRLFNIIAGLQSDFEEPATQQ